MIIGLTGRARSGKDTAGAIISRLFGLPGLAFADPLKEAAIPMFGLTRDMVYGINYDREQIVQPWGMSVRDMLQRLGTECAREVFRQDFWMMRADITLATDPMYAEGFVMKDIRFDNEAEWILDKGGVVLMLHRSVGGIAEEHKSERGVSDHLISKRIPNEGTLGDLEILLETALSKHVGVKLNG